MQTTNMMPKQYKKEQEKLSVAYEDCAKKLNSYAFFRVSNRAISEDLVQDVFIKNWTYLVKGGKINIMKSFLFHILRDLIIDEYRKRKSSSLDFLMEKGF